MLIKVMINDRAVYLSESELNMITSFAWSKAYKKSAEALKKDDFENAEMYSEVADRCFDILKLLESERSLDDDISGII